jgi:alpha-tubulin suppressor-like RCC1 family protein
LGDGTTTSRSSPGTTAGGGTTWCAVSVNAYVSNAIKTDGTLWTWGCNFYGNLGDGTTTNRSSPGTVAGGGTNWCAVSVGSNYSVAIKTDGTVWTWGLSDCGALGDGTLTNRSSPTTILGGSLVPWTMVSAGGNHGLALSLR